MVGSGEFPIGKVLSFVVVLAMTALPVVSCDPVQCMGHEILRNEPPDVSGFQAGLTKALGGGAAEAPARQPSRTPSRDKLFPDDETWMWFLYLAVFGLAVASFFLAAGSPARAALGLFGLGGMLLFLYRFEDAIGGRDAAGAALDLFSWDVGAYLAVAGFGLILLDGLRSGGGGRRVID